MRFVNFPTLQPNSFELYTGCMKSGKSRRLLERIDQLSYVPDCSILSVKPKLDKRDQKIKSRFGSLEFGCSMVEDPFDILSLVQKSTQVIAIDELNLFGRGIFEVVDVLMKGENK